ncbi:MAG: hypothetical protein ACOC83_09725, partial [Gemmatimonadota bacterium]
MTGKTPVRSLSPAFASREEDVGVRGEEEVAVAELDVVAGPASVAPVVDSAARPSAQPEAAPGHVAVAAVGVTAGVRTGDRRPIPGGPDLRESVPAGRRGDTPHPVTTHRP